MTDADSLRRAAEGAETVVHLVALPPFAKPAAIRRVMEQGTRDLVAAAKEAGAQRFVLMSALGTSERSKDLAPYYHAKWEEEHEVAGSGIDHTIFRPSFIFGAMAACSRARLAQSATRLSPRLWDEEAAADLGGGRGRLFREGARDTGGGEQDIRARRPRRRHLRRAERAHPARAGQEAPCLPDADQAPQGRCGRRLAAPALPRGARRVAMLEFEDNVTTSAPRSRPWA